MDPRLKAVLGFVRRFWWPLSIASFLLGLAFDLRWFIKLPAAQAFARLSNTYAWKVTNYSVNYIDFGFVKRGTLGCLMRWLPPNQRFVGAIVLYLLVFLLFVALLKFRLRDLDAPYRDALTLIAIASPLGFQNLGYDFLRYDEICLVTLAVSLILVERGVCWPMPLLAAFGILTHEGFALYGVPVIVAQYLWLRPEEVHGQKLSVASTRWNDIMIAAMALVGAGIAALTAIHGRSDAVGKAFDVGVSPWTMGAVIEFHPLSLWLGAIGVSVGLLALWLVLYRSAGRKLDLSFLLLFSPLGLLALATDWARFSSLNFFATLLVVPTFLRLGGRQAPAPSTGWLLAVLALFCVPLGPIGIIDFFPYVGFMVAIKH
ncbi:MAG TPA: hypothetical protein VMT03_23905 [Polyangia bacterium]|nr:hypothetical protein [Polyangia bacterium]